MYHHLQEHYLRERQQELLRHHQMASLLQTEKLKHSDERLLSVCFVFLITIFCISVLLILWLPSLF